jgi:uncharacterized DUF497 family protein
MEEVGRTIISDDGRYEWDERKDRLNIINHGFGFAEITDVFDDPFFLEEYDGMHSTVDEDRYYGVGNINHVMITVFFTERETRSRVITARESEPIEEKKYNDNIEKAVGRARRGDKGVQKHGFL